MAKKALNNNFHNASRAKEDEFYTQLSEIEKELKHYKKHFKDKVVYCNCDDPRVSNFFHYFSYNFEKLGLKKLITTCYKNQERDLFSQNDSEKAIYLEYDGDKNGNFEPDPQEIGICNLKGDGDFRSQESIELLNQADSVIFQTEKQLKDFGDKIPEDKRKPIEEALEKLRQAHKDENIETIDSAMNELNTVFQAASQEMYNAQEQAQSSQDNTNFGGNEGQTDNKDGNDEVTDVDFEEVK